MQIISVILAWEIVCWNWRGKTMVKRGWDGRPMMLLPNQEEFGSDHQDVCPTEVRQTPRRHKSDTDTWLITCLYIRTPNIYKPVNQDIQYPYTNAIVVESGAAMVSPQTTTWLTRNDCRQLPGAVAWLASECLPLFIVRKKKTCWVAHAFVYARERMWQALRRNFAG